jgi:SAM-dependent methyltransferase
MKLEPLEMEVFKTDRWKKIVKLLPKNTSGLGLDIGAYWPMTKKIEKITGMKILQLNVEKSQVNYGCIGDAEKKLPFKNNCFDFVFLGETIEHIWNTDLLFEEIRRILKKNGIGIITTPNLVSFFNRILFLLGKLPAGYHLSQRYIVDKPFIKNRKNPFKERGHIKLFTVGALKELLQLYGFKILKIDGYYNSEPWRQFKVLRKLTSFLPITWREGIIVKFMKC